MEYQTAKHPRNQLVVWDKIIRAKDFHRIDLNGVRPKYPPCDIDDKLPYASSVLCRCVIFDCIVEGVRLS